MTMIRLTSLLIMSVPVIAAAAGKSPDESFYKDAAEGGMAEVELGQMAQQKGQSQAVRDFGARMVKDHSAANEKLKSVAGQKGIELPTSPGMSQKASAAKLKMLSGDSFDKSYIKGMVKDHEDDIAKFEKEASSGQDPDARAFASATLPTLKTHLSMIRSIAGIAAAAGSEP